MRALMTAHAGLLFAGIASFVLMGAGQSLYGPALPAFSRAYGVTVGEAGLLVSAHWVGCLIGIVGMFRWGASVTPRHALVLMGTGMAGIALLPAWALVVASVTLFGVGYGCATAVFNPRMLQAFGPRGPAMLSFLNAVFGIGAIAAPLVFVALDSNLALTFALVAGVSLIAFAGAGSVGPVVVPKGRAAAFRPRWGILGFGLVAIGMEACLIGLGPTALIRAGVAEPRAAELLSAFFAAFLGARVALIFCAHLIPSFTLFALALLGAGLCGLGAALVSPGVFFVATGLFAGLFFPGYYVTASAAMGGDIKVPPTILLAGLVGGIASPLILPPLLEGMGDHGFFWLMGGVSLTLAALAALCLRAFNRAGVVPAE